MDELPLEPGAVGESVRDLQRRLAAAGFIDARAEAGHFGPLTGGAVEGFQAQRGLRVSGVCDRATWAALVEAGYQLGDRLLYLKAPMMRGDDVAELQRRLGALGFDAGRVDGILGPATETAIKDFERNAGLTLDGVCGPDVLAELARLGARGDGPSVAGVREREHLLQTTRALDGCRVAIGEEGGLGVIAEGLAKALQDAGAAVALLPPLDPSAQAAEANRFDAEVFINLAMEEAGPCWVAFYATEGFESAGGRRLASLAVARLRAATNLEIDEPKGMRLPILRETRMPAVVCSVGPPSRVVPVSSTVARALATTLDRWIAAPVER